jgi:hypothetical protein
VATDTWQNTTGFSTGATLDICGTQNIPAGWVTIQTIVNSSLYPHACYYDLYYSGRVYMQMAKIRKN